MAITKGIVEQVAHLARIDLQPKELDKLSQQLKQILGFIDKLNKIDVAKINPMSHILPNTNVFRGDSPGPSLPGEKVLENTASKEADFFIIPKVIE